MRKIRNLDTTLKILNQLTADGSFVTVEDLQGKSKIERYTLMRVLEYLNKSNYCENLSNGYRITFEGEYLLDKTLFLFKNRPFLLEKSYKLIRFTAYLLNTLLVLALAVMNYQINKEKLKKESEAKNYQIKLEEKKDKNCDTLYLMPK